MEELTQKLNKLKEEAITNPPKKVKGGCKSCKKKKVIESLSLSDDTNVLEDIPTVEEIRLAYANLSRMGGPKEDERELINKVFIFLYGSEFDFTCRSCGNKQYSLITNYIKTLK